MNNMAEPIIYGIRHLSPAGAWHLRELLEKVKPDIVLIEGPSDLTDQIPNMVIEGVKPPIAIMAYTKETPIRTILYPFAEYSPEYEAICWCSEHNTRCQFIDLPSSTFLALRDLSNQGMEQENMLSKLYKTLDEISGEAEHETFWERMLEHTTIEGVYQKGASEFGIQLRELTQEKKSDYAETVVREAYMRRKIEDAKNETYSNIVVVTGAYHVKGLQTDAIPMTDSEIKSLPKVESASTLMPYSYYRLSSRSGYGAGNKAPAYYDILYKGLKKGDSWYTTYAYLSKIASFQRNYGHMVSSAEVIEAVRLATALAQLHGGMIPTLQDLRDAAVTCLGHGNFSEIALAVADTEIGKKIGRLPEGISRTSIQEDFYHLLHELRLDKYKSITAKDLTLDLREKLNVKSEKSAMIDLNRSFFLHKMRILDIHFAMIQVVNQEKATWSEHWILRWTPETEIEIVESALKGDTIELATSFVLKEKIENSTSIAGVANVIWDAFLSGMTSSMSYALRVLQKLSIDAAALTEIAKTAKELSTVIKYGNIRKFDATPLIPIVEQLFLRACLLLPNSCLCDNHAAIGLITSMQELNEISIAHDFIEKEEWMSVLHEISRRDDLNTKASGYAMAILLERGEVDNETLGLEVQRRLSKGVPADLGATWFEGFSMKNRYALIARMSLWRNLSEYLDSLDDSEFKRALVFLRRAFADFNSKEKNDIAENLGEIWNLNPKQVSEILNNEITASEQEILESLEEFDFSDI